MAATLALFIQYLPALIKLGAEVPSIIEYVNKMRETYKTHGEWTPEAEEAFTKELQDLKDNPPKHWKKR